MNASKIEPGEAGAGRLETIPLPGARNLSAVAETVASGVRTTGVGIADGTHGWLLLGGRSPVLGHRPRCGALDAGMSSGFRQRDMALGIVRRSALVLTANSAAGEWDIPGHKTPPDVALEGTAARAVLVETQSAVATRGQERLNGLAHGGKVPKLRRALGVHVGGCAAAQSGAWNLRCRAVPMVQGGGRLELCGPLRAAPHRQRGTAEDSSECPGRPESSRTHGDDSVLRRGMRRRMRQPSHWRQVMSDLIDWALIMVIGIALAIVIGTSISQEVRIAQKRLKRLIGGIRPHRLMKELCYRHK